MMNKLAGELDEKGNTQPSVMFSAKGYQLLFMTASNAVSNNDVSAGRLIREELVHS